ncbi:unnamed protein product [Lathyrus oleraceus]
MQFSCGFCIAGCSWSQGSNGDGPSCKVRLPYHGIEVWACYASNLNGLDVVLQCVLIGMNLAGMAWT